MKISVIFFRLLLGVCLLSPLAHAKDLLPPLEAFKPSAHALDGQTIEVRFVIANGYYLYRDKFRFDVESAGFSLSSPVFPQGQEKQDETFGKIEVYYDTVLIRLPVERQSSGTLPVVLKIKSQGCADVGVCFPPQTQVVRLELPNPAPISAPALALPPVVESPEPLANDESGRISQFLKTGSYGVVLASFFGFGLLLALTPCVFPMIPILSGIIVGARRDAVRATAPRSFLLSLAYVLGMATTYAAVGVAAGLSGTLLSTSLQTPWVLGATALLLVVLSFSMFGFYELQLPTFLRGKINERAPSQGGSLSRVALMGAFSVLVVSPCIAAPLAGALLYIGQSGNAWLGGLALFCLALGMGVPLLALGLSAGALLPKAGAWMENIKRVCGVLLLGTAIWIASPLVPIAGQLAAWASLLIISAVALRATDPLLPQATYAARFWKGVGVILLLLGIALMIGALSGAPSVWQPLAGLKSATTQTLPRRAFERVRSIDELDARLASAQKPVLLDFYADWCVTCQEMEQFTFSDARVQAKIADWILLKVDVTANTVDDKALLSRFSLFGPPATLFFDAKGSERRDVRVIGFQNAQNFLKTLNATNF